MAEYQTMQERPGEYARTTTDHMADTARRVSDKAAEYGEQALVRTQETARSARDMVMEHPLATLAIAAGVAFALGALWKVGHSRQQSPYDRLMGRLGDLQNQVSRSWGK